MEGQPKVEIISVGTELLVGDVINTNQHWLAEELTASGYEVTRQVTIGDDTLKIQDELRNALKTADGIIMTGGLGPTSDDLTRTAVAGLFGRDLEERTELLERIQAFFKRRGREMPEPTRVQALVPKGGGVFLNEVGTAPGIAMTVVSDPAVPGVEKEATVVLLPGPPQELQPMVSEQVLPYLRERIPVQAPLQVRHIKTSGLGESGVQEQISPLLAALTEKGLKVGYCARPGEVEIRLTAAGRESARLLQEAEDRIRSVLGTAVFGADQESLEERVLQALRERGQSLVTVESCTGGEVSNRLTDVRGASNAFAGGLVVYSNEWKIELLGVRRQTLLEHGAISEATAYEMADTARRRFGVDYALSITGIAGPDGGSASKPVGTVYIGLAGPKGTVVTHFSNPYPRHLFKEVTSRQALNLLRLALINDE